MFFDPETTAVLIVDLQNDFLDPKGGPFRSYVFYDPGKDLTYHINYLIFYPGNTKSIFFRQADMILKTFQIY